MESILSFNHYDVLETIYRFNPGNELETETVDPELSLNIKYTNKDKKEAMLMFTIKLGDPDLKNNSFYIKATILGVFSIKEAEEEITDGFINHMYRKNTLAILYPYIRALVSDLSSRGSENPIILPPINIGEMVQDEDITIEEYDGLE